MTHFEKHDVLVEVLSRLSYNDARRASQVCKAWHKALRDPQALRAMQMQIIAWEREEGICKPSSYSCTALPTPNDCPKFEWVPSRFYDSLQWDEDTTVAAIMQYESKRQAIAAQAEKKGSAHGPENIIGVHRKHHEQIDRSLLRWMHDMSLEDAMMSHCPERAQDRENEAEVETDSYPSSETLEGRSTGSRSPTNMTWPCEAQHVPEDAAIESPRQTFSCNFATDVFEASSQHVCKQQQPPQLKKRNKIRPRSNLTAATDGERGVSMNKVRRKLDFGPITDNDQGTIKEPSLVSESAAEIQNIPGPSRTRCRPLSPPACAGIYNLANVKHLKPSYAVEKRKRITKGEQPLRVHELKNFARHFSVTKHVHLLGTCNDEYGNAIFPSRTDHLMEKVISQVSCNSMEIRVTESFQWHRSSVRHQLSGLGLDQTAASEFPAISHQHAQMASEAGGLMITRLHRRYNAVLNVQMRTCPNPTTGNDSNWEEVIHVSQHNFQHNFRPGETFTVQRANLKCLCKAWGLQSFTDSDIVTLIILLSGRQPVQVSSLLSDLVDGMAFTNYSSCFPKSTTLQQQQQSRPCYGRQQQPSTSAEMIQRLPRLTCMTDPSFLEDISWVRDLERPADAAEELHHQLWNTL